MQIVSLSLNNFKNHAYSKFEFSNNIVVFEGLNGVGKTNILDSIYFLCLTKSYFNTSDLLSINKDSNYSRIEGKFKIQNKQSNIVCKLTLPLKKEILIEDLVCTKYSEHIGKFPVVFITPYDIELIHEGSEIRRKFIDTMISQIDGEYLKNLLLYNKIILQRNAYLKSIFHFNQLDNNLLDQYHHKLNQLANIIFKKRSEIIPILKQHCQYFYSKISGNNDLIEIKLESDLNIDHQINIFKQNLPKDYESQRTNKGIHKDDILLSLNNLSLKKYSSQGQQKTFLLALKFAQWQIMFDNIGIKPIILLDDIYDRLDDLRINNLIEMFTHFNQIFITDTQHERLNTLLTQMKFNYQIFSISIDNAKLD